MRKKSEDEDEIHFENYEKIEIPDELVVDGVPEWIDSSFD